MKQAALTQFRIFAGSVLAEARSSRILFTAGMIYCLVFLLAIFLGEIAITETRQTQAGIASAFLRLAILFYISLFTINSIVRDMNDRMLLLYLSLPVSRSVFILAKFLGFALMSLGFTLAAILIVANFTAVYAAAVWGISLLLESLLVIAFSLLCAISLGQLTIAFAAVVGIYLLSRTMSAILLMAHNPMRGSGDSLGSKVFNDVLALVDYVLPRIDRYTRSDWVMYELVKTDEILFIVQQTTVYLSLLLAVCCFDFYRKNI